MKDLNDEIKLTLNLMQTDIDDGAHSELQSHLYSLLKMKRNEIQQRLVERPWVEPATHNQTPHKSGPIIGRATPLSIEELKAGGWWCADVSKECAEAFKSKGLRAFHSSEWGCNVTWDGCTMDVCGSGVIRRFFGCSEGNKQIHRIGIEFYWGEK